MHLHTFIKALPKAEMHLHLEGIVPWHLARRHAATPPTATRPPWHDPHYRFADFDAFRQVMQAGRRYLQQAAPHYSQVAATYFHHLLDQNVRYVELTFGMGRLLQHHDPAAVVAAIHAAVPPGLYVRLIAGINRRSDPDVATAEAQAILSTPGIVGIDLQGDERINTPCAFMDLFRAAKQQGYLLRAHAGELTGASTISATLDCLGVTRIEHGVTACQDPALRERLRHDPTITLDMCPTSNLKLGVVANRAAHPIADFLRSGIRVTCSTDDPAVFGVSLSDELQHLVLTHACTAQELALLQVHAFRAALLPQPVRDTFIADIHTLVDRFAASVSPAPPHRV